MTARRARQNKPHPSLGDFAAPKENESTGSGGRAGAVAVPSSSGSGCLEITNERENVQRTADAMGGARATHLLPSLPLSLASFAPASFPPSLGRRRRRSSAGTTLFIYANAEPQREGVADIETRNLGPSLTVKNPPHVGTITPRRALLFRERKGSPHQLRLDLSRDGKSNCCSAMKLLLVCARPT